MAKQAQPRPDLYSDEDRGAGLESALLRLATDFVNLPYRETKSGILRLLEFVADFTGADCSGVSRLDRGSNHLEELYTWERPGSPPRVGSVAGIDVTGLEALFGDTDAPTLVSDVTTDARLPEGLGEAFAAFGVRSMAWLPISADETEIIAIGITHRLPIEWAPDHTALLHAAGRMIANLRSREHTHAQLEEKTLLLDELSRSIDHHFFMFADDPPRILYSNKAVESLSGERSTAFDADPASLLGVALPEYRRSLIALFAERHDTARDLEYRIRHVDGSVRWLRTQVFPGKGPSRHGRWLAVLSEDITVRITARQTSVRLKEFEHLLSWISSRFVQARLGTLDSILCEVLATVSSFVGVDRSHIYLLDRNREAMSELVRWYEDSDARGSTELRFIQLQSLPFFADATVSGRTIALASYDELPSSASAEREFLKSHGVRSAIIIPLATANGVVGAMVFTSLSTERAWSADDASMLRVLGDVVAGAVARRESESQHQDSRDFERLITSLISEFMNLPSSEVDSGIARALETIARFVDGDRSTIYILDETGDNADLFRGWWAPGNTPVVADHTRIDTSPSSLYGPWLRSTEPHLVFGPDVIEPYRLNAAQAMRNQQIGTVISLPLEVAGRRIGWFSVGAPSPRVGWNATELRSLRLAADTLANMYTRHCTEDDVRRHKLFDDTLSRFAADFIKRPISEIRAGIEEMVDGFGQFAGCDRAAILLLDQQSKTASMYHEWLGHGESALIENFPIGDAPRFYEQLMTAQGPWIMHRDEFPESDAHAAIALEFIGIETLLNCPITDGTHMFGYASIGYSQPHHRPAPGTEQVLAVAAGIIANALARERLENDATDQRDALARALRQGSMSELATGIAHELNQPLAAIANYSRAGVRRLAAAGAGTGGRDIAEILDRVSEEALRAGDLIHRLRNHVKGGPAQRSSVSINHIVDHAFTLLAGNARQHRVELVIDHGAKLPDVDVAATEIEQVVINLVQNAIDSIADADPERREVRVTTSRNRSFVEVEVADTGPGIGHADAEKLFDQFHTTKPGGLGLGLSISRYLIESNGGSIEVDPESGGGASFRFALPVGRLVRRRTSQADRGR